MYTGHPVPVRFRGNHWKALKTLALTLGIKQHLRRRMRRELRTNGITFWNGEPIVLDVAG